MRPGLLLPDGTADLAAPLPAAAQQVATDLDVEVLVAAMAGGDASLADVSRRVLLRSRQDPDEILYRQRILADCAAHPESVRDLYQVAVDALADRRKVWGLGLGSTHSPSSTLSTAINILELALPRLVQLRRLVERDERLFRSDGLQRLCREVRAELDDDYLGQVRDQLRRLRFKDGQLMSARLDWDNSGKDYMLRRPDRHGARWRQVLHRPEQPTYAFSVDPRDEAGSQALGDLTARGVNQAADALARSAVHVTSYFTALSTELAFYLGCLNLRDRLAAIGLPLCLPEPAKPGSGELSGRELCDPGLALRSGQPVVGNDLDADDRALIVITGANSGGKSTFLRGLGLAQLMMQAGMWVTARSYRAATAEGIFTHFARDEDESLRRGRLDDELARLSDIADDLHPHALVLFNESFAGTNEHEGSEIARQTVRALLETDVRIVFVTHLYDFADSCHQWTHPTLFLRADRAGDGTRRFRLREAPPLPSSFGQDLYQRIGRWLGEAAPATHNRPDPEAPR